MYPWQRLSAGGYEFEECDERCISFCFVVMNETVEFRMRRGGRTLCQLLYLKLKLLVLHWILQNMIMISSGRITILVYSSLCRNCKKLGHDSNSGCPVLAKMMVWKEDMVK